jgi:DNA repair protein SbcC/Rad50
MKPLKLILQAFGPYPGREEVDFRDAVAAGLFGIYGPTGSGKSSIFSAMTFALFGESAKDEQRIATLRSDHAPPDLLTEVEFLFELANKTFYVRRRPDQMRPKARGTGETEEKHSAWLFDVTGVPLDEVTSDNCGRLIAEKKVGDVDRAVRELLGYGATQFRQIVLLPQGRFEKFLAAGSNDRMAILRDLFDVSLYRSLADKFVEDAKAADLEVSQGRELCAMRLSEQGFESAEALRDGIVAAEAEAETREGQAVKAETEHSQMSDAYARAQALEARFAEAKAAESALADLESRKAEVERLRGRVAQLRVAVGLADFDREAGEARAEAERSASARQLASTAVQDAENAHLAAEAALRVEVARVPETERLQTERDAVARYREILSRAAALGGAAEAAAERWNQAKATLKRASEHYERCQTFHRDAIERLDADRANEAQRTVLAAELQSATSLVSAARQYEAAAKAASESETMVSSAEQRLATARSACQAAERHYQNCSARLVEAQAQRLAELLESGEPCPVCGSRDHPKPASGTATAGGLEEAARAAEAAWATARRREAEEEANIAGAKSRHEERTATVARLERPPAPLARLEAGAAAIAARLEELGDPVDVRELDELAEELEGKVADANSALISARDAEQQASQEHALAAQELDLALDGVPEALRTAEAVEQEETRLAEDIAARNQALASARDTESTTRAALASARTALDGAEKRLAEVQARAQRMADQLDERLAANGLSLAEYRQLKTGLAEVNGLAEQCEAFDRNLSAAKGRVEQARAAIATSERPDLDELSRLKTETEAMARSSRRLSAEARARTKALQTLASELSEALQRLDAIEAGTGPLRALAAAFKGENPLRTPLETYAIGALFDHVLTSANLRFTPMTGGRYRLERDIESVGGRGRRGLDVRVHDTHTGRAREICTLSGGETFIAALSLALGLSDVVETSHGKIRLDTIFIDEGFGSLDAEDESGTLDQVLQVLQDIVGRHRAVGLISHVPQVQQAIPNGFTIRKELCGSFVETRAA